MSKFLFLYCLTPHSTTGSPPAQLLLGRLPWSKFDLVKPDLSDRVQQKQDVQRKFQNRLARECQFVVGDAVFIKDFPLGKTWIPGTVSAVKGPMSYRIDLTDGRVVRRHVDHVRTRTSTMGTSPDNDLKIPTPTSNTSANEANVDNDPVDAEAPPLPMTRRSTRNWIPPDYLRY